MSKGGSSILFSVSLQKLLTSAFHPMPLFQWTGQKHVYPDY